jgi:hypothetical protein
LLPAPHRRRVFIHPIVDAEAEGALFSLARVVPEFYMEASDGVSPWVYWWDGVFTQIPTRDDRGRVVEVKPPEELASVFSELRRQ